jgi:hypothetical protein
MSPPRDSSSFLPYSLGKFRIRNLMKSFSEILELLNIHPRPQRNGEANRRILANFTREPANNECWYAVSIGIDNSGVSLTTNISIPEYNITYAK